MKVAEVFFYHLQRQPLEQVLPRLLMLSLGRGWRALVKADSPERVKALDDHLWSYSDESFLPHGTDGEGDADEQPVLLTGQDGNGNGAAPGPCFLEPRSLLWCAVAAATAYLLLLAAPPADLSAFSRVSCLLDGTDEGAVAAGRTLFRTLREAGHDLSYWQQDEDGRWARKA